ncbi:MAG: sterol desaturase family protein [Planctomycetota bacterium]|nr:sterol desaturase family protein [Planctomycetota bacterium]
MTVAAQVQEARTPDLSQPILEQVADVGDGYDAWVHNGISPKRARQENAARLEAGDKIATRWPDSVRIFRSDFLESLSHPQWRTILAIWVPVVTLLIGGSIAWAGLAWGYAALWALGGLVLWTLTEYLLHRFFFHYRPRSAFGRKLHFLAHGIHHLDPWDPTRLVFPPLAGFGVGAIIFGLLLIPLPLAQALATMGGLLAGYIVYDMTHYYTHHARPKTRWGKFLKAWHLAHHHKYWTRMYGVSSPLWDVVFRTGRPR